MRVYLRALRVMHCNVSDFSRLRAISGASLRGNNEHQKTFVAKTTRIESIACFAAMLDDAQRKHGDRKKYGAPSVFFLVSFQAVAIFVDFQNAIRCLS